MAKKRYKIPQMKNNHESMVLQTICRNLRYKIS